MGNITLILLIHSLGALKIQTSAGTLGSHSISSLLGDGKGFVISQFLTYFVRVEVKASCDRNMPCKYKEEELHLNTSSNLDRRGLCSCQRNFQEGLQEQFPSVGLVSFPSHLHQRIPWWKPTRCPHAHWGPAGISYHSFNGTVWNTTSGTAVHNPQGNQSFHFHGKRHLVTGGS